jgi:hypothetical protein
MNKDSKQQYQRSLSFIKQMKIRKSKRGDLLIYINSTTVISLNRNYITKILQSSENDDFLPTDFNESQKESA